jgi:competence/damage-inducible protein CinA-like protein
MTYSRHDVEVILVGNELLRGDRADAHLAFLGNALRRVGARIERAQTVGDDVAAIAAVVTERLPLARVLILTGGLGPTDDDITRDGVAQALGVPLHFDEAVWADVVAFFAARGRTPTETNRRQAHFPEGSAVLGNAQGTAPGFSIDAEGATIFVLPGPPRELQPMVIAHVLEPLARIFDRGTLRVETFRTVGIGESQLFDMLLSDIDALTAYTVSWLPTAGGVDIVLTQTRAAEPRTLDVEAGRLHGRLDELLGTKFFEHGERPIAKVVGDMLAARAETVAVAESLTGGTIGRMITDHPGSSAYFLAGAVTYSNDSKTTMLGVRAETIEEFGAVSEETCTEMAHGIRRRANATYGIATTGIAGPDGGSPHKPVGLTYLGVAWEGGSQIRRVTYPGNRAAVRERASHGALWLLYDQLRRRG